MHSNPDLRPVRSVPAAAGEPPTAAHSSQTLGAGSKESAPLLQARDAAKEALRIARATGDAAQIRAALTVYKRADKKWRYATSAKYREACAAAHQRRKAAREAVAPPKPVKPKVTKPAAKPKPTGDARYADIPVGTQPCRFPFGHPGEPDFHFCYARALVGKPYCAEHQALTHLGTTFKGEPSQHQPGSFKF